MIRSFADKQAQAFFETGRLPRAGWAQVSTVVARKLDMLDFASRLDDLKSPPGNKLEALRGTLRGYHSIRVNDQWRIIFRWNNDGAEAVSVTDYH